MPKFILNDQEIEAKPGQTIIQAAQDHGIAIPHYCYHPDLPIDGNCRMCLVEVEKMPKLTPACATIVGEGMIVRSNNDRVREAVRGVLEFLLINHPVDCPVCDQAGECRLQDYYMIHGLHESEIPLDMKVHKRKVVSLGEMVVLDQERCILCSRCVRFFDHVTHTGEMQFFGRGDHNSIGTFEDRPLTNPYSGNVVDICPVGALTSRDFRFKARVWFLHGADSICAGCSTGCNTRLDYRDGKIFRMVSRRNPEVNKSWMCDEGRLSFHRLEERERVARPMIKSPDGMQAPVKWEDAFNSIDATLKEITSKHGRESVLGLASASATNEALFLFKRYLAEKIGATRFEFRLGDEDRLATEKEDELLRRLDKNPNTVGAIKLGFRGEAGGIRGAIEAARAGNIRAAVIIYFKPLIEREGDEEKESLVAELVNALEYSVLIAPYKAEWQQAANALLPAAVWSEEEGTYTNYQGRVQFAGQALTSAGDAMPVWEIFAGLLYAGGESRLWLSYGEVFQDMKESVACFGNVTLEQARGEGALIE
jgi:NADH-quinone oxidoreductase subunit G